MELLGVGDVAGAGAAVAEVREHHLVVDAVGVEADRGVDPVPHRPGDGVLDGVPDGPVLHAVGPLVAVLTGRQVRVAVRGGAGELHALVGGVVGLDLRRPEQPRLGVGPRLLDELHDPFVLAVRPLRAADEGVGERVGGDHAVEVDAAGPVVGEVLEHLADAARLGLRPGGVAGLGVAELGPVAVEVHPVAVEAQEAGVALVRVATAPAVGVGEDEVGHRAHQHLADPEVVGRAPRLGLDRVAVVGLEDPSLRVRPAPGREVLDGADPALDAGALDAVHGQRPDEVVAVLLGDRLDVLDEPGALGRGDLHERHRHALALAELVGDALGPAVAELLVEHLGDARVVGGGEVDDVDEVTRRLELVGEERQPADRLVVGHEGPGGARGVALGPGRHALARMRRVLAEGRDPVRLRVGEDPSAQEVGLLGVGDRAGERRRLLPRQHRQQRHQQGGHQQAHDGLRAGRDDHDAPLRGRFSLRGLGSTWSGTSPPVPSRRDDRTRRIRRVLSPHEGLPRRRGAWM